MRSEMRKLLQVFPRAAVWRTDFGEQGLDRRAQSGSHRHNLGPTGQCPWFRVVESSGWPKCIHILFFFF